MLFRQVLVLFFLAGIAAAAAPLPGVTACLLLVWADSRAWRPAGLGAALICAAAGWLAGVGAEPPPPREAPAWVRESLERRPAVRVRGEVLSVQGLVGQRLRVVLAGVRPADAASDGSSELPGRLVWTWDHPEAPRPLAGQTLDVTLRVRPVRGFRNDGGWDSESYWRRRGVLFQAWSRGSAGEPRLVRSGARLGEAARERLRAAVCAVFETGDTPSPAARGGPHLPSAGFPTPPPAGSGLKRAAGPSPDLGSDPRHHGWTLLPALLFGDRFHIQTADNERMASAGLAHSLALSGQHLAVVGLAAFGVVVLIGRLKPDVFLHVPAPRLMALCALPPAAAYLWLGDAPPSLLRAGLMLAFWALFIWRDRPTAFPDALMAALTCMILADPLIIHDLGAQLSFSAVAGIALIAPLASRLASRFARREDAPPRSGVRAWLRSGLRRIAARAARGLWLLLACSLAAQLATWPLVMRAFGYVTLWFPLNLIWLPILGCLVLPLAFLGLACLGVGLDTAGAAALHLAAYPCDLLVRGLRWLEQDLGMGVTWGLRPHWTAVLGCAALLVGLAVLLRDRLADEGDAVVPSCPPKARVRAGGWRGMARNAVRSPAARLILAAVPLLMIGPCLRLWAERAPDVTLRVFDVGQSQAVLLEWPDKGRHGRALVDGGGFFSDRFDSGRDVIAPLLTANRTAELDWLMLSHPDRDHLKGLLFFAAHFSVRGACTADLVEDADRPASRPGDAAGREKPRPLYARFTEILEARGIPRRILRAGDRIALAPERCPELFLEVLAPAEGEKAEGNNGLVLRLVNRGKGLALLPGDAEAGCLRRMLRRLPPEALRAEVLVLPHHGSAGSFLPALYDAVRPRVAVVSAGTGNAYRLPAATVRAELARRGIPLHVTAEDGDFSHTWNADGEEGNTRWTLRQRDNRAR